jgi:DNA-binding transcriptional LysR family regulator
VGKGVARLENQLGVRLFHRSTRMIRLTPEGAMFVERCRRILADLRIAETELSSANHAPQGKLRLSVPLASGLLLPMFTDFMQNYPAIELDIDFTNRYVDLIEEGFDAAVRVGELEDSRLMSRKLGEFRLILVGSPIYFARHGMPKQISDLYGHDCLFFRFVKSGKVFRWPIGQDQSGSEAKFVPKLTSNENMMLIQAAKAGLGIACVPDFTVKDAINSGLLQTVLDKEVNQKIAWSIIWPSSPHLSPKMSALINFMSHRMSSFVAGDQIKLLST